MEGADTRVSGMRWIFPPPVEVTGISAV